MSNIAAKIAAIRSAIFGKDVRESIASGLETMNVEVEDTTDKVINIVIPPSKTTFVQIGVNIFDKDSVTTGFNINPTTGLPSALTGYSISEYIAVVAGQIKTQNQGWIVSFFTEALEVTGSIYQVTANPNTTSRNITVPVNAVFMRSACSNAELDSYQIENGSVSTSWKPFEYIYRSLKLSVDATKLDAELSNNANNVESLFFNSLYSTFEKHIIPITDDFGTGTITGVISPSNITPIYDVPTDKITFDASSQITPSGTVMELFLKNSDLAKVRNGFSLDFDVFTPMTLGHINIWVYSVKSSVSTQIYADVINAPVANQVYSFNRFYDGSLIPSDADALRVYIDIDGCTVVSTKQMVVQYFNMLIGKISTNKINIKKSSAKVKLIDSLGFNDVLTNINTILPIQKQLTSGILTLEMCESVYAVPTISGGILSATFDVIHRSILFPVENKEITFRHIVEDDWILIGGDNANFTTLAIGTHNIYLVDYTDSGTTVVNIVTDIVIADLPVVGDIINLKWVDSVLIAKKNKNDGNGFTTWFSVDIKNYPIIVNCATKRFGAITYLDILMSDVDFTPLGLINVIDTLNTNKTNEFINKKCNFVGDSITFRNQYQPIVNNALGLAYTPNYGVSSCTVAVNNSYITGASIVERIIGCVDADIWVILGGVNDWLYSTPMGDMNSIDNTTFYGALKEICINILSRTNHPKLILCTPLQSNRNGANSATPSHIMLDFCQAIKDIGQYYSVSVLDLYNTGGINPINLGYFTEDGIHPTLADGMPLLAKKIIGAINSI